MTMNLKGAEKAMAQVAAVGERYGAISENRKTAAYINKITRQRFAKHASPDGTPWQKTKSRQVKLGDVTVVGVDDRPGSARSGRRIIRRVRNAQEAAQLNRNRPGALPALARSGKFSAKKLRASFTKKTAPGHLQIAGKKTLVIGSRWKMAVGMQYGIGKRKIPAREFYGLTEADLKVILDFYLIGYFFQIEKASGGKIKFTDFKNKITA